MGLRLALIASIALGLGLRFALAYYNLQANDNHMEVVRLIVDEGADPLVDDCWQCCHAKLFHRSAAHAIEAFSVTDRCSRTRLAQLLNATAGGLTLWILWSFLGRLELSRRVRVACFALLALNPRLIAISAQATNDSFVILFGAASLYAFWRTLPQDSLRWLAATGVALILASVSKTQGWVLFAMISTVLAVRALAGPVATRRPRLLALSALVVVYLGTVPFLGPYYAHYQLEGSMFAWNTPSVAPPAFWEKSEVERPGVRSFADAFLTFRLADMLRHPTIGVAGYRGRPGYWEHRTSLWSQLHGRFNFIRFDDWPPMWISRKPWIFALGRTALVLGLLPLALLGAGFAREVVRLIRGGLAEGVAWLSRDDRWTLLAFAGGMLFMVGRLSYDFRDFSAMKVIYVFPGLLAFAYLFAVGLGMADRWLRERPSWRAGLYATLALLVVVHCVDATALAIDLVQRRGPLCE